MTPNQTIGRYRIVERVGRGGMGVLYRGIDPVLDREVAIKVMSADFIAGDDGPDEESRARFFREARAAAKLQHRNIVTIFEFAEEQGVPYIVMEFLRGRSLAGRMRAEPPLTLDEKLDIVTGLCTGLHFAHEHGVIHRDVKPANVWLLEDGTVKLLDFGIAKVSTATFTRRGEILGSACYMAPEQVSGGSVDARADVFAASVVLYELLAGRKPFDGDSPTATLMQIVQEEPPPLQSIVPDLPALLNSVVSRGLRKNPANRYQSAADLAADLELVRMSLQSTGDTVNLGLDQVYGDADGPASIETDVSPRGGTVVLNASPAVVRSRPQPSTPSHQSANTKAWVLGLTAAIVLLTGIGWYGATHVEPGAWTTWLTPSRTQAKPAALLIETDPPGAAIEIDGRDTQLVTPATLEIGEPPPRRLRLTRAGFQTIDTPVTDVVMAAGALRYRLTPQSTVP